jgi:demethylmenaquinone methyltransferase/2-methoxy-6-polyprenyl-1,4-benzoquinol methylase
MGDRSGRRRYYDLFSRYYDRFVALHSSDASGKARELLGELTPVAPGGRVLDLCSGTGALLPALSKRAGAGGLAVGLDFSRGMLDVSRGKNRSRGNVGLVEAEAAALPFGDDAFDAVTCSHAFYELKGDTVDRALAEIVRVLKPGGTFLMMEHDIPKNPLVRALFYVRMASMGASRAVTILHGERELLSARFAEVRKVGTPGGRSKIFLCRTAREGGD